MPTPLMITRIHVPVLRVNALTCTDRSVSYDSGKVSMGPVSGAAPGSVCLRCQAASALRHSGQNHTPTLRVGIGQPDHTGDEAAHGNSATWARMYQSA